MVDTFGWRCKFGVITPSTNTIVQPDYDDRRPAGVTNHISRMHIPDDPVGSDADFNELIRRIDVALEGALERVLTCRPDHIVLGISAESIWGGGLKPAEDITRRIRAKAGQDMKVTQAAYAFPAALRALGIMPGATIGLVTPYFPVAAKHLKEYVEAIGYKLGKAVHLSLKSPVLIAHADEPALRQAVKAVDGPEAEAIIQFGANLAFSGVALEAEKWLGKPVLAVNPTTYWHALRGHGIADRLQGFGRLFAEA